MAQFSRPDADDAVASWTVAPLWQKIDETTAADSDFISSETILVSVLTPTTVAHISMSAVDDAPQNTPFVLRCRAKAVYTLGLAAVLNAELREGSTLRATCTGVLSTSYQTFTYTLSTAEAALITDYTALALWVSVIFPVNVTGSGQVSWAEFEVPIPLYTATGTPSLPSDTATGAGLVNPPLYAATGAPTVPALGPTGAGVFTAPAYAATGAPALPAEAAAGSGLVTAPIYAAAGTPVLPTVAAAGEGLVTAPVYVGSGSADLLPLAAAGAGLVNPPVYAGAGTADLEPPIADGQVLVNPPVYSGAGTPDLGLVTPAGNGTFGAVYNASGAATLPTLIADGAGVALGPAPTYIAAGAALLPSLVVGGTMRYILRRFGSTTGTLVDFGDTSGLVVSRGTAAGAVDDLGVTAGTVATRGSATGTLVDRGETTGGLQ